MSNTLKIHVAAESIATGRVVLSGRVSGPIYEVPDGNIRDVPEGALVYLPPTFDGEFDGDVGRLAGIISAKPGLTGYAALIARELDIPMISGATLNGEITDAAEVTLDAERGVLFEGEITAETERTAFRGDVSTQ